ncbi:hypothetical protein Gbem_3705 [Citrifermentans bemidjiense Bem]|uniref:Uncharacterized protein n=1 Tax=Citrifermentans bemidjiense (strain ATCC BAA-1014 / DSM 16622 / JCM 12645 / Bem) TaxID=404380 RepID=B5EDR9_CITBB|nr:hypothetical protein [Citrifermentans bemidjiense]ACH40697.1 hypothetical protein Gbem_3705 [Citrifermentans bemidjiense Bem]
MEKELTEALQDLRKQLQEAGSDVVEGDPANRDRRLTEITEQLKGLAAVLARLEESLTAASLAARSQKGQELDPEIRAMLEKND